MATALGMEVTEPQLLRSTNNTVIWLRPTPVVVKVAPAGSSSLAWELMVASALGRTDAPVVGPWDRPAPVVHRYGEWAMTFWPYQAQTGLQPDPVALARALGRLHDALDEVARLHDWSLPSWDRGPRDVILRLGNEDFAPELHGDDRDLLTEVLCRSRRDRRSERSPAVPARVTARLQHLDGRRRAGIHQLRDGLSWARGVGSLSP